MKLGKMATALVATGAAAALAFGGTAASTAFSSSATAKLDMTGGTLEMSSQSCDLTNVAPSDGTIKCTLQFANDGSVSGVFTIKDVSVHNPSQANLNEVDVTKDTKGLLNNQTLTLKQLGQLTSSDFANLPSLNAGDTYTDTLTLDVSGMGDSWQGAQVVLGFEGHLQNGS